MYIFQNVLLTHLWHNICPSKAFPGALLCTDPKYHFTTTYWSASEFRHPSEVRHLS